MNAMPGFSDMYASANRRRDEATAELQRMREANAMVPDAAAAMIALANTTAPGATAAVAPAAASDASGYNSDDTIGFPDGSQLSELLAGQGGAPTITAY